MLRFGLPFLCWHFPRTRKAIYLSFDDGPVAGVSDKILDLLDSFNAQASFFCLGRNVDREPSLIERMRRSGHSIGNHTYSHLSGWHCSVANYLSDIDRCDRSLPKLPTGTLPAFRPPFGELGLVQGLRLSIRRSIVMWDVNAMDYRSDQTPPMIANRVCQHARSGSIVLMHDSTESGSRTIEALPIILQNLAARGFSFESIEAGRAQREK